MIPESKLKADCTPCYVAELEQELARLKESQTQKSIIKLCERVDKAKQQVEELKKENESLKEKLEVLG